MTGILQQLSKWLRRDSWNQPGHSLHMSDVTVDVLLWQRIEITISVATRLCLISLKLAEPCQAIYEEMDLKFYV